MVGRKRWFCPHCGEEFSLDDMIRAQQRFQSGPVLMIHGPCGVPTRLIDPPDPAGGSLEEFC